MASKTLHQIRIGETLKYIREEKDFSAAAIAKDIISKAQLSRIEKEGQTPNAESFIKLLYRLNVSFEEFCLLSDDDYLKIRTETREKIADVLRKKNPKQLKQAIKQMDTYYDKYKDSYFNHMSCVTRATLILGDSNYDYSKALDALKPVSDYLLSVDIWFDYEIALFINCIYLYPLEEAIVIGNKALEKFKNNYILIKNDNDLARSLLLNLASYALSDEKYYHHAHGYSSAALSLPQSTHFLYSPLLAKIVNQVACYKLKNIEYDEVYLTNLINGFKLMKFDDLHKQCVDFITKHGITINDI